MPSPANTPVKLLAALLITTALTGCSVMNSSTTTSTPNLTGYWEFQNPQSIPVGAIMLQGALQSQGSQVTGILNSSMGCTPPIIDMSGTIDPTGNLTLTGLSASAQLTVPASATSMTGTAGGGGYLCNAVWAGPVTAVKIASTPSAPLTGTFAGSIIPANATTPMASLSLALTQSSTPNATGEYSLTATLTYTSGTCSATFPVVGTLTGFLAELATATGNPQADSVSVVAATNPTASQLSSASFLFFPSPCSTIASSSSAYTGILTRQ
jgi:hypothetical protein